MTVNFSATKITAIAAGLAGLAGTVLGAIDAGGLAEPVQGIITALGGLLVAIAAHHVTKAAVAGKPPA